jgi:hypothetical protein
MMISTLLEMTISTLQVGEDDNYQHCWKRRCQHFRAVMMISTLLEMAISTLQSGKDDINTAGNDDVSYSER